MIRASRLTMFSILILVGGFGLITKPSLAASDYRFEMMDQTIHVGESVTIGVRLIQVSTGKPIMNATIKQPKLQMMMGKMEPMPSPVKTLPPDTSGNYRLACDVTEPGNWELSFLAQVPSEKEPAHVRLKFKVVK